MGYIFYMVFSMHEGVSARFLTFDAKVSLDFAISRMVVRALVTLTRALSWCTWCSDLSKGQVMLTCWLRVLGPACKE